MKSTIRFFALLGTALILFACQSEQGEVAVQIAQPITEGGQSGRPNIIFIMTDDHAYQAIGAYGSVLNETPNIDRIAAEGVRFDRAYVTNSICSPSRAVILTGKHSHINGVRNNVNVFDGSQQTFPKLLQEAGYQTAMIGKWHLKSEPTGFDYWRVLPGQGFYYQPEFRTETGTITLQGYVTDLITDMAIEWLQESRDPDKPFMMMYQHKAPHREWLPAQNHLNDFKDALLPEPETLWDDYQGRGAAAATAEMRISDHMGLTNDGKLEPDLVESMAYEDFLAWYERAYNKSQDRFTEEEKTNWDAVYGPINEAFRDANLEGEALTKWKYQRYMQDYLASINSVDENIGRLLEHLDESGLADNTIIVYTSDQGFFLGEHGWFDKRFMYEESFRTPLIVRWPGVVEPGSVNKDLVQNLDFASTLLDVAGVDIPSDMQGMSLVPLLTGVEGEWREALYYHYYEYPGIHAVKRHYGISTARYKLIHFYHDIDEWELYDLEADPQEMNSVYGDEDYADVQGRLEQQLAALRESYGDSDELSDSMLKSDLVSAFESQPPNTLTEDEEAEGFRLLFDGETTTGWRGYNSMEFPPRWTVQDGMLAMVAGAETQHDLVSEASFENFELRLQWKISEAGNSGIMFNVVESETNDKPWKTGPEFQILDDLGHSDAVEKHLAGDLYDLLSGWYRMGRPAGEWNESRIKVNNGRLQHWLNGLLVIDTEMWTAEWDALVAGSKFGEMQDFGRARRGLIALQDHGDPVWFRSIRIREF